jgi:serine/threonine-protein kinase
VLRGERASAASDIYAFGCVVYESITGSVPFAGKHTFELGVAHLEEAPPDPGVRRSGLSSGLCWALLSALAKDPAERPTSGLAYATMLRIGAARAPA